MRLRPAPSYENGGLAISPRKTDCIGESCPVAEKIGRCFVDEHHLYFPFSKYLNRHEEYKKLLHNPFSKEPIARCRHNSGYNHAWHSMFGKKDLPKLDVAARFNEETEILELLGLSVKNMAEIVTALTSEDPRKKSRVADPASHVDQFYRHQENFNMSLVLVGDIEVVPQRLVGKVVNDLCRQRSTIPLGIIDQAA
jgi:hypothetical protein